MKCCEQNTEGTYLCHLLLVVLGVEGYHGEQQGVFLRSDSQLVVEGVMPDLLHVIPVSDDSTVYGILETKNSSHALSLASDVTVV